MSVRQNILQRLTASPNLAVERIVELALLARPNPRAQEELLQVISARDKRAGWIALVKVYDRLTESVQGKLLERCRNLYGPLSEAMQDIEGPTRANVIEIVRRCDDPRLVYLLAQALIDGRPEIRDLAGRSLLAAVRKHRERGGTNPSAGEVPEVEDPTEFRRAVNYVLCQYKTHKQPVAVLATLLFQRQHGAPMWAYFQDPHDDLTKTAMALLRTPPPALGSSIATATLLALASPLKPAAIAGFSSTEDPALSQALARESYRLLDPRLRKVVQGITHLKMLAVLWKEAPPDLETWAHWLRLVDAVGLQLVEKIVWFSRLFEKAPATGERGVPWKLSVMNAFALTGAAVAGRFFARMLADPDQRVARCAARHLLAKNHPEWRGLAATAPCPHPAVRRILGPPHSGRNGVSCVNERVTAVLAAAGANGDTGPGFGRVWGQYPEMPPAMQHRTARSAAAADPQFFEQMKLKLTSHLTLEIAQGLKMINVLPDLSAYRPQIIALCGHADVRVAAIAVRLIGRLEDPKLKDLLEAAARHPDRRVRANAVESMAALHIANHSQQVLALLNSRHNRERANAIKAISEFNFATAKDCLQRMLADTNPLHRISALWVVEQLALPGLFRQISSVARRDPNTHVRKRAADMLETLTGNATLDLTGR